MMILIEIDEINSLLAASRMRLDSGDLHPSPSKSREGFDCVRAISFLSVMTG